MMRVRVQGFNIVNNDGMELGSTRLTDGRVFYDGKLKDVSSVAIISSALSEANDLETEQVIQVTIIAAATQPDHVHMLVSIPPKLSVSEFMGYLKGKSTLMLYDRHPELVQKGMRRNSWA